MADTNNAGASGAPDAMSQGVLFRDGPEDLARIGRYEDYLRLQSRAENMSNAEYLKELEGIMKEGDGFDRGESSYGQSGPGSPAGMTDAELDAEAERKEMRDQEERVRANLEHESGDGRKPDGNAALLDAETEAVPEGAGVNEAPGTAFGAELETGTEGAKPDGVGGQDDEEEKADPDGGEKEGEDGGGLEEANGQAVPVEEETFLTADPVAHEPGHEDEDGIMLDADGNPIIGPDGETPETAGPAVTTEEGPQETDDSAPVPEAAPEGAGAKMPDTPAGPGLTEEPGEPDTLQGQVQPGAAAAEYEPEVPAANMGPAGTVYETVPGHVETYEQAPQVNDFLDELSVSMNMMDCVETSVYVPEKQIEVVMEEPDQPAPARSEKAQQLMYMAEQDRQMWAERGEPDGPSR